VGRSLIGQLQRIPGAAVFTFDYHPYLAAWIDDPHLGPALGRLIDCLYRASGEKVIIVAHSLGGLIARYAATHPGATGADRSGEISSVVTFGTPETGSVAALLLAAGTRLGAGGQRPARDPPVHPVVLREPGEHEHRDRVAVPDPARAGEGSAGT
jgi:pimeloyl-ACP methyl ester carboxylesterase